MRHGGVMEYPGIVAEAGKDEARCCHRSRDCGVALAGIYFSVSVQTFGPSFPSS
jgi:hypothetical protein